MSDKLCVYGAKVHIFSDIYKKYIYIILQKCFFLLFLSLIPCISAPCKRPKKNQRRNNRSSPLGEIRTKERPKNAEIENVRFVKIALSFFSLTPSPIPPREHRPTTEKAPTQLPMSKKCVLLRFPFSKP